MNSDEAARELSSEELDTLFREFHIELARVIEAHVDAHDCHKNSGVVGFPHSDRVEASKVQRSAVILEWVIDAARHVAGASLRIFMSIVMFTAGWAAIAHVLHLSASLWIVAYICMPVIVATVHALVVSRLRVLNSDIKPCIWTQSENPRITRARLLIDLLEEEINPNARRGIRSYERQVYVMELLETLRVGLVDRTMDKSTAFDIAETIREQLHDMRASRAKNILFGVVVLRVSVLCESYIAFKFVRPLNTSAIIQSQRTMRRLTTSLEKLFKHCDDRKKVPAEV